MLLANPTYPINQSSLEKWGYASMTELLNWRWFRKFGGGPLVDLGSHQIDLFPWIFGCQPASVVAVGGTDYYRDREWYDNVCAHFEFKTPEGVKRASYQVLTTNQFGGFHEIVRGINGTLVISEISARGNFAQANNILIEERWAPLVQQGLLKDPPIRLKRMVTRDVNMDIRATQPAGSYQLGADLEKKAHTPHLENFFDAIRNGVPLNCPAEQAYACAVAVHKANEAVAAGRKLDFTPDEFVA
jgi:predicted dehydrogenase